MAGQMTAGRLGLALIGIMAGEAAVAQSIPAADLRAAEAGIQQQEAAQGQAEEARRTARQRAGESSVPSGSFVDPLAPAPGGPCFDIRDIRLTGFEPFQREPDGYRDLVGHCATAADIAAVLNGINQHYQDLGYITTRAYVPEQDLSDGALDITVVPGRLEGYVYSDGAQADARIRTAFPSERGALLNLRELEQGLDNLNTPRSASGRFQLIPGEQAGGSFVQVYVEDSRPWHADVTINNTGFENTGEVKATANVGFDNLMGMNDQLSLGLTTTPFDSRGNKYSDAYSLSWSMPLGLWSFGLDAGMSDYFFILPGINQSYPVEGRSHYVTASAERLLRRSQTSKVYAYGELKLSRTRTFIDEQEIETQRRRLTIASLGLRGDRSLARGGKLDWDVGATFGLDAFGANVLDKSIVNPEFRLLNARVSYEQPLGENGALYRGTLVAQHSDDILPGTEQVSIGSWSTVRGFHDDSMYGDSGVYLRNTVEWDALRGKDVAVRMNAGLDVGYVAPSDLRSWSQNYLVGVSLGADITVRERATLTLQLAHALSRPEDNPPNAQPAFEADRTVGYIGLRMEF
nr:ShlB/FhaC/HecB family hemolysin secretion/activation protein [uncultured Celeribacter sp.]